MLRYRPGLENVVARRSLKQQDVILQHGMGAGIMIRTGARSPVEYLMKPISRSFGHALREQ